MSKYRYSEGEQQLNNVLNYQDVELKNIQRLDMHEVEKRIVDSEELLSSLGYSLHGTAKIESVVPKKTIMIPTWEELCAEAEGKVGITTDLESLFTEEELGNNEVALRRLNNEYNMIHKLDKIDYSISIAAGLLGAIVDILLIGIPQKTPVGLKGGPLSNYVRDWFNKKFPEEEMQKLANAQESKVSYDAQDNRNTKEYVTGLSAYYHRLLSLGHDPLLGFIIGVSDIMSGKMTTVDKTGKIVSQVMENYADRKEANIFAAIAKQIIHLKSDITTSMGLPVPLMGLFNLFQFGSIGEAEQTVAEIVQGMYYEGYDFIHFCSMSIPTMIVEVLIRIGYAFKRIKEGHSIKDSIPFSLNREKHPKLSTMLFLGHSTTTAVNAGKVYFTQNPVAINYPQWIAFTKYSYKQLKWALLKKPELRDAYVRGIIKEELYMVYDEINKDFDEYAEEYIVVIN